VGSAAETVRRNARRITADSVDSDQALADSVLLWPPKPRPAFRLPNNPAATFNLIKVLPGAAGKLCAGNPAALHNNGKDLNWSAVPLLGAWHHVALTYDGTTESIYLDGALQASAATNLNITAGTYYPMIFSGIVNATPNNTSFSLNGAIAAVRVHTAAFTATDVSDTTHPGTRATPPVGWGV